ASGGLTGSLTAATSNPIYTVTFGGALAGINTLPIESTVSPLQSGAAPVAGTAATTAQLTSTLPTAAQVEANLKAIPTGLPVPNDTLGALLGANPVTNSIAAPTTAGTTTSNVLTFAANTAIKAGMLVSGAGIPANV